MHRLPAYIIFRIRILGPTVKDKSFLLPVSVRESDLNMKLFLVQNFHLNAQEWLEEKEIVFASVFRQLQLR